MVVITDDVICDGYNNNTTMEGNVFDLPGKHKQFFAGPWW